MKHVPLPDTAVFYLETGREIVFLGLVQKCFTTGIFKPYEKKGLTSKRDEQNICLADTSLSFLKGKHPLKEATRSTPRK